MLDLGQLSTFIQVVEAGSFTAAGIANKVSKSNISRNISNLEENLGIRLFERTTRRMRLTQAGEEYYEVCKPMIEQINQEHQKIISRQGIANGLLRIAVPTGFFSHSGYIGGLLAKYQEQYPDVTIEVIHAEQNVNLIEKKCDLGFHLGELPDSSMIARSLGEEERLLCATPEYVMRHGGFPIEPKDLQRFKCVSSNGVKPVTVTLQNTLGQEEKVKVPVSLSIENQDSVVNAILNGAGIANVAHYEVEKELAAGKLVPLFNQEWIVPNMPRYIMFPSKQHLPLKARKFIDFLLNEMENDCQSDSILEPVPTHVVSVAKTATVAPPTVVARETLHHYA